LRIILLRIISKLFLL